MSKNNRSARDPHFKIRLPKVHPIGFSLPHGLMNVALSRVRPCDEGIVIDRIDAALKSCRYDFLRVEEAHALGTTPSDSAIKDEAIRAKDDALAQSLMYRPVHATLLGRHHLVSLFQSSGFSQCHVFGTIERVLSQQVILGDIPVPLPGAPELEYLDQATPDAFLPPYDATSVPEHVLDMPILTISQLEVAGLTRSASASNIVLPLLLTVDRCFKTVTGGNRKKLRGLLLGSYGWSDFTLLLRGDNLNEALECVDRLRKVRLSDILDTWEELAVVPSDSPLVNAALDQLEAFKFRLERLGAGFAADAKVNKRAPFISASTTIPGVLWPIAEWAVKSKGIHPLHPGRARLVSGSVAADILIAVPSERDAHVESELGKAVRKWRVGHLPDECRGQSLGLFDRVIPASFFCLPKDAANRVIDFEDLVKRYYYLRAQLAKSRVVNKKGPRAAGEHPEADRPSIRDMELLIRGVNVSKGASLGARTHRQHFTTDWEKFVFREFGAHNMAKRMNEYERLMKSRGINRSLQTGCMQVVSMWHRELGDAQESVPMIELCDVFITWINAVHRALEDKNNTTGEIEDLIRSFTEPFGQAVLQRALTGYRMSDQPDYAMDFKGGLSRMLTGLDGLVKATMSIIGPPLQAGCLTLVSQGRSISTAPKRVRLASGGGSRVAQEYLCAVLTIDFPHLVHPLGIATVLHELLHVVILSGDFQKSLEACQASAYLLDALNCDKGGSSDSLGHLRLEEMLVEYVLAWLVFQDDPDLYARTTLAQQVLNPEFYSHSEDENRWTLTEHASRAFVVTQLLVDPIRGWKANLDERFSGWWEENAKRLFDQHPDRELLPVAVLQTVAAWLDLSDFVEAMATIQQVPRVYFESEDTPTYKRRAKFLQSLRGAQNDWTESATRMLDAPRHESVHFVFFKKGDRQSRTLQARRMESLVGYLVLIRSFYNCLDDLLKQGGGPLVIKRIEGGAVTFGKESADQSYYLDPLSGTLFTVGDKAHKRYLSLRLTFLSSMWHLAEVMKLSSALATNALRSLTKQECIFLPHEHFQPDQLLNLGLNERPDVL